MKSRMIAAVVAAFGFGALAAAQQTPSVPALKDPRRSASPKGSTIPGSRPAP